MSLIEVKLRPTGPWRVGHHAGDRERVDVVYHSDALYSAVTHAMRSLGWLEEWLSATVGSSVDPAVRFSSLFPFMGKTRLVAPPKSAWPPVNSGKLYLQGARLIPLEIVKNGVVEESRWAVDGESECLLPMGVNAPFRVSMRSAAAVDRLTGAIEPHRTACLEFAPNAGWWGVFSVSDAHWEARVKSALRLLADSGFGGERSRGWGRSSEPQFSEASHLFASAGAEGYWWLLSAYSPHEHDLVDWSLGEYSAAVRGGWTDSPSGTGAKKSVRLIEEGSVLAAPALMGRAVDVAPDGFPHPVYRSGFAFSMPAPLEIVVRNSNVRPTVPVPESVPAEPVVESTTVVEASSVLTGEALPLLQATAAEPEAVLQSEADSVPVEKVHPAVEDSTLADAIPVLTGEVVEESPASAEPVVPVMREIAAETDTVMQREADSISVEPVNAAVEGSTQVEAIPAVTGEVEEKSFTSVEAVPIPDVTPEADTIAATEPAPKPVVEPESPSAAHTPNPHEVAE